MTSPRVLLSGPARSDLAAIFRYLNVEAGPDLADLVIAQLFEVMHRAAEFPLAHRERTELAGSPRRLNVFDYGVFYDALPSGEGIRVLRILHGRRDLSRRLGR